MFERIDGEYQTKSIYEAAFLAANQVPLNSVVIDGHGRAVFHFCNKDDMAYRLSRQFFDDTCAPARSLFLEFGRMKQEVVSARAQQWQQR